MCGATRSVFGLATFHSLNGCAVPEQRAPAANADVSGEDSPTQIPARGGRLGNAATRAQNTEIAAELEARGYKIIYGAGEDEEYIRGRGPGTQGGTFVDITAENMVTGKICAFKLSILSPTA